MVWLQSAYKRKENVMNKPLNNTETPTSYIVLLNVASLFYNVVMTYLASMGFNASHAFIKITEVWTEHKWLRNEHNDWHISITCFNCLNDRYVNVKHNLRYRWEKIDWALQIKKAFRSCDTLFRISTRLVHVKSIKMKERWFKVEKYSYKKTTYIIGIINIDKNFYVFFALSTFIYKKLVIMHIQPVH